MKKIIILIIALVIAIVAGLYGYFTYNNQVNNIKKTNTEYETYYNKEIYGAEFATIINKAIDNNEKYAISKDNKGKYIENDKDSIKIDIKIIDNNTVYDMETIYNGGISNFVANFNMIKFKCTNITYHKETGKIKYMYFEQITK